MDLSTITFSEVSNSDNDMLIAPFTISEVWNAIVSCGEYKAPGPDGFNFYFDKRAWHLIQHDLMKVFDNFFSKGSFPSKMKT